MVEQYLREPRVNSPGVGVAAKPVGRCRLRPQLRYPESAPVTHQSTSQFLRACGAAGPLRLSVESPAGEEVIRGEFDQPFLLIGREEWADLPLANSAVSRRHAFLQVIDGRLFCF